MSTTVDNRVVEMRFDNQQFESNVQTSLSTLDKLKSSLNMSGAAKGLDDINASARGFNMSGMGSAVDAVKERFSALQVMAVTALANITNSAVNAGKKLLSSFTTEPIKQGFGEYELKMNSVQTIMASTGKDIDTVNKYLNELNTYADKTIYSFSDMTASIGKFTNSGVSLDNAVKAIQGISNEAAVSGANTNEASRAMYNFAQALSAGSVKLMDWKSIENANMATVEFKQQLLDTAVAMGTVVKKGDKYVSTTKDAQGKTSEAFDATSKFNESLSSQWMTTDVLIETLGHYSTDIRDMTKAEKEEYELQLKKQGFTAKQIKEIEKLGMKAADSAKDVKTFTQLIDTTKEAIGSGWSTTFELIFGNLEESKKLWTGVSDVIGDFVNKTSDARNNLLQGWKDLGGRTAVIEGLKNAFTGIATVIKPIGQAFRDIFPPITAKQLFTLSKNFKEFTSHMKLGKTESENLKRTFKGLFAVIDMGKRAFLTILGALKPVLGVLGTLGKGVLEVTAVFGDWLVTLDNLSKKGSGILDFFKQLKAIVAMKSLSSKTSNLDISKFSLLEGVMGRVQQRVEMTKKGFDKLTSASSGFAGVLDKIKSAAGKISEFLSSVATGFVEKISNADFSGVLDLINAVSIGGLSIGIAKIMKDFNKLVKGGNGSVIGTIFEKLFGSFGEFGKEALSGITDTLDSVRGCFEAYQTKLKAGALLQIAAAIAILAASIVIISFIDSNKLGASLGAITALFADLMGGMAVFTKISGDIRKAAKAVTVMIGLSVAVLIMATALKKVSSLDPSKLAVGLGGIIGLTTMLVATAKALGSGGKTIVKGATQLVIFAVAINILASACEQLSSLNVVELGKGLGGVGVLLGEIALFLNKASFDKKSISAAVGIVIVAAAIKMLAGVCKEFGEMHVEEIVKGLGAVGALLTAIGVFTKLTGNTKNTLETGVALIAISVAVKILASAIGEIAKLNVTQLATGILGMGAALAVIGVATRTMPAKDMVVIGAGMYIVANAMVILANALSIVGKLGIEQAAIGLITLGASLGILAVALNAMNGTLPGSAALLVAAVALGVLTPVLQALGNMSWEAIAKGLFAIAGAFTILGVAGFVLGPIVPVIIALSGALALVGVSFLAMGVGLLAAGTGLVSIAAGFTALAAAVSTGATALVAGLSIIITGIANLIPTIAEKLGEGVVAFCEAIASSAPQIANAAITVVKELVRAFVESIPIVVDGLFQLMTTILETLRDYAPQLIQTGMEILISFLEGIANNIQSATEAGVQIIVGFIDGIASKIGDVIDAGFNLLISFIDGLTKAIDKNAPRLATSMRKLFLAALNAAVLVITGGTVNLKKAGEKLMKSGLVKAIKSKAPEIAKMIGEGIKAAVKAVISFVGNWLEAGAKLIGSLVKGLMKKGSDVKNKAIELASKAVSAVVKKVGEWANAGAKLIEGFVKGIKKKYDSAKRAAHELIEKAKNALSKKDFLYSAGKSLVEGFIKGIGSLVDRVKKKATELANAAKNTVNKILGVNSPSKEFIKIGRSVGEGFVLGIEKDFRNVSKVTATMANGAIDSAATALNTGKEAVSGFITTLSETRKMKSGFKTLRGVSDAVESLLNTGDNLAPTIRPVLDLSNVKSGASSIAGLLSGQYPVAAMANVNGISAVMNRRSGNTNEDVVDAINTLRKEIGNVSGNSYNFGNISYDDGSSVSDAVKALVRAIKVERRV